MALTVQATPDPDLASLLAARPFLDMHARDGLCFEYVPLNAIADAHGTPVWVYGAATIRSRYGALVSAFATRGLTVDIHYAAKANDHLAILNLLRGIGAGADVVSLGEFLRAQRAGIAPGKIVFSGVGKTTEELAASIAADIGQINIESAEELTMVAAVAAQLNRPVRVAFRINPDVEAGTHAKISTGRSEHKFGIPVDDIPRLYAHADKLPNIEPVGIALHIGSQIVSTMPFELAFRKAANLVRKLRQIGFHVSVLDLGGGLGIGYGDEPGISLPAYAAVVHREAGDLDLRLKIEPGRYLVGPAGLLVTSVILEKFNGERRFMVVDAAMNDLIRPAMYDAWHGILPVDAASLQAEHSPADIVGPVCETGDRFAEERAMPELRPGQRLAILDAGAYGAVMSSNYNARPKAAAVLVEGGSFHLITERQSIEDQWAKERIYPPAG